MQYAAQEMPSSTLPHLAGPFVCKNNRSRLNYCHNGLWVGVLTIEQRRRAESGFLQSFRSPFPARNNRGHKVMKSNKVNQHQETKWPKVVLILVVVLVAFSSAMKELNQARVLVTEAGVLIADWVGVVEPTVNARSITRVENCSANPPGQPALNGGTPQNEGRPDEFHWSGRVAPGAAVEIKGINGDIRAEPATGDEVQVVAAKRSRRSDVNSVTVKVVEHAGGVTICAIYPNENSGNPNTYERGPGGQGDF